MHRHSLANHCVKNELAARYNLMISFQVIGYFANTIISKRQMQ